MIIARSLMLVAAILSVGSLANAEEKKAKKQALVDQVSGAGYGTAGCGLGSILFGAKPGKIQILSSTTNGVYSNNTFGITSGTSNCDIAAMGQQAAVFIEVNREIVKKDAARGNGETLASLSELMNCSDAALFGQNVHDNYDKIFADGQSAFSSARELLRSIKGNQALASTCDIEG